MQKTGTEVEGMREAMVPKPNHVGLISQQKKIPDKNLCMFGYQNMAED